MLRPLIVCGSQKPETSSILLVQKPFIQNNNGTSSSQFLRLNDQRKPHYRMRTPRNGRIGFVSREIKVVATSNAQTQTSIAVTSTVTVQKITGLTSPPSFLKGVQDQKSLNLELASQDLDPRSGLEKATIKGQATLKSEDLIEEIYEASFEVPSDFGNIGAVFVENKNNEEKYVKKIVLHGFSTGGSITVNPNSWVQPSTKLSPKRVFFPNKSYLPSNTPGGIRKMRSEELVQLRGDGTGVRQKSDRIYDYDVYNDLGDDKTLQRPVLGGIDHPYPRRCRTGRPHYPDDPTAEERPTESEPIYVPRDESFSDVKQKIFDAKKLLGLIRMVIPKLEQKFGETDFPNFNAIDGLYDVDGFNLSLISNIPDLLPKVLVFIKETAELILRFKPPEPFSRDRFFWLNDEEFARQTLAGLNPCSIQLVTEWPLKSALDPDIYGPPESAITSTIVDEVIGGSMTVEEAIAQKKVFILDYHDALLPYVEKVRDLKYTTLYGSRTLFFLNPDDTLRPLVIELTRPQMNGKPQWKRVFIPSIRGTDLWLWRLAKAHVLAHDAGFHQLISHWLRTHCAVEPYAIATHRQLSAIHPIFRLLHPHFRYTLEINAFARNQLINAGGTIESTFAPGKYSMEFSSDIYKQLWRFDTQALPADLISRGMAVEDSTQTHGVKLTIQDYPFANDGLILWDALKQWVTEYVSYYYQNDPYLIQNDTELQAWWKEIRTVGHRDKQEEAWWPNLNTQSDLIGIITNIAWVASVHHAAVNFGQYAYAGYIPNRPSIIRTNLPIEDCNPVCWDEFLQNPEQTLLRGFPTQVQATTVMFVLDLLSSHSPDEEYLGRNPEPSWVEDPYINEAFVRFSKTLNDLDTLIDHKNKNSTLKNRTGAGVMPYELLKTFSSGFGLTGKGIPYSVSI